MMDLDAFFAECDDVISDWEGSGDSASWSADGSHERETHGRYYLEDRGAWGWLTTVTPQPEFEAPCRQIALYFGRVAEAAATMSVSFRAFDTVAQGGYRPDYMWADEVQDDPVSADTVALMLHYRPVDVMHPLVRWPPSFMDAGS